jgi:hypothetical protein
VGFERDIVGVVIVVSGLGFLSYRLERASEPKAHELGVLLLFLKKKGSVKKGG